MINIIEKLHKQLQNPDIFDGMCFGIKQNLSMISNIDAATLKTSLNLLSRFIESKEKQSNLNHQKLKQLVELLVVEVK